jgi:DNA invertase Pin-like site-specific DNA recombinase
MTTQPLRLAAYVRVSRVQGREGPGFLSPEQQRAAIEAYCTAHGHTLDREAVDLDVSGSRRDRPGLDSLLAAVKAGEVEGIIVARMDRLSRLGIVDAMGLVQQISDDGGAVVAVDLGMDPSTATGEMMWTFLLALARYQWRMLAESWEDAKGRALDRGAKIGPTPLGYRRREDGTLEPHPERAEYVRKAFRLARQGVPAVVAYLDGLGLVHEDGKRAGRPLSWSAFTVRRLLANRSYLGEQVYAGRTYENAHAPLVSAGEWKLAQHEAPERRAAPADFPLSGVASCSTCGGPMVGGRGGKGLRTYRCAASLAHAKRRGASCAAPATMVAHRLEEHLDGVLRSWADAHGALVLGQEGEGDELALTLAEAEEADAETAAYVQLTPARSPGYADGLRQREEDAAARWAAYRDAAEAADTRERVITGYERMDVMTSEEWGQVVRDVVAAVEVKRGRGPVEGRVQVILGDAWPADMPEPRDDEGAPVGERAPLTDADVPAEVAS